MQWGLGETYTTYTMGSRLTRADAVADLESMGYQCSTEDTDGKLLMDVGHSRMDGARVRCTVLRADHNAVIVHR